jgi:hypothetical protein
VILCPFAKTPTHPSPGVPEEGERQGYALSAENGLVWIRNMGRPFNEKYRPKLTWRGLVVIAAAVFVVVYPMYVYVQALVTGGIVRRGDLLDVDLQAMSSFEMDQDHGTTDDIPKRYRDLDGKRVELHGQMWDPYAADGKIRAFTLVYSISNCCFLGPPKVQHFVQATVPAGKEAQDMSSDFVDVVGTLHVGVNAVMGHVQSVYRIDVESVRRD